MRAYTVDCSGDEPVVTGLKTYINTTADFGMNGGNYGPPNYLTLASGNLVVAGSSYARDAGVFVFVFAPDGTLVSKTFPTPINVYFAGLALSPDDPNTVSVVCGDTGLFEISGLDTPTPTYTYRISSTSRPYPFGSSSPYYAGPGMLDTGGDSGDPHDRLWGWNLSTFQHKEIAVADYSNWWPNGGYELGDGRVFGSAWGKSIADDNEWRTPGIPYNDPYSRFFFVDYRSDPPAVEMIDIKPENILPDRDQNVTGGSNGPRYAGYMNVDELGVGSTSVSVDPSRGLVVRGSTVLSDRWANDVMDGERYTAAVWTIRGIPAKPDAPMPPRALPVYSEHELVPISLGAATFASESTTFDGAPTYDSHIVMTEEPDSATCIRVGTPPLLDVADDNYLRKDYVGPDFKPGQYSDASTYLGSMLGPWTVPPERTMFQVVVEFDVYLAAPLQYGIDVHIRNAPGTSIVSNGQVWNASVAGTQTAAGWKTYTVSGTVNAWVLGQIAAGTAYLGIKPDYLTEPMPFEVRLGRLAVSADLLKAPSA
jgi:hypothetical protein